MIHRHYRSIACIVVLMAFALSIGVVKAFNTPRSSFSMASTVTD